MASKLAVLRDQRKTLLDKAHALNEAAETDKRELTDKEFAEVKQHLDDAKALAGPIKAEEERQSVIIDLGKQRESLKQPETMATPTTQTTGDGLQFEGRFEGGRLNAENDRKQHGFQNVGEFYQSVFNEHAPGRRRESDQRLYIGAAISGMGQAVGADGGFAVPPAFSTTIWDGLRSADENLLSRTDNFTVTGESLTFVANAETSRARGSQWGGAQAYWIAEADQLTDSNPKLRQVKIEPQQLAAMVKVTDKLLKNNQVGLEQYVSRAATSVINFEIGDAIINGTGAGKPAGIMSSGCLVTVSKETGQAANTIQSENIVNMWARGHANSRVNAVWLINQDIEPQLQMMTIGVGTSGLPSYMPPGGISASPYATLLGKPVVPVEYCATLGTTGDIILADLKAYVTGTQGGIDSAMSMHLRFDYAETAFRFMFAVDGQTWLNSAITPFKGSNTLSPFVALATRA